MTASVWAIEAVPFAWAIASVIDGSGALEPPAVCAVAVNKDVDPESPMVTLTPPSGVGEVVGWLGGADVVVI